MPDGTVQLDFVFNEALPVAPIPILIPPLRDSIATAPPELALAWKLLWLHTDWYPQGKDLYDAVLLAEFTPISLNLVRDVLRPELGAEADLFTAASVLAWRFDDWDSFLQEYPAVHGHPTAHLPFPPCSASPCERRRAPEVGWSRSKVDKPIPQARST